MAELLTESLAPLLLPPPAGSLLYLQLLLMLSLPLLLHSLLLPDLLLPLLPWLFHADLPF